MTKQQWSTIRKGVKSFTDEKIRQIDAITEEIAADSMEWMKQNATWQDRTGAARQSLYAEVDREVGRIILTLGYDVERLVMHPGNVRRRDYSVYLEAMRYGILSPALGLWSRELASRLRRLK